MGGGSKQKKKWPGKEKIKCNFHPEESEKPRENPRKTKLLDTKWG